MDLLMAMVFALVVPVAEVGEMSDDSPRNYPGRICPVEEVSVRPQVTGEILEVCFANGQEVKKGDVLYRLDSVQYNAAFKNAQAKVAECKATRDYAQIAVNRYDQLIKTRAVSQDECDKALVAFSVAEASLAAAEASAAAARDDLAHCTIVAPISGRVGTTRKTVGNFVQRGDAGMVDLVQTDPIRVRFQVSNADYAAGFGSSVKRIVEEATVELRLKSGDESSRTGRVEYVENLSDALSDTAVVYALVDNPQGAFLGGQTVMVTLRRAQGILRAAVPPNAVAQDLRGHYVWVVGDGNRAERRDVVRGALRNGQIVILNGLRSGERIVTDGVHLVRAGDRIEAGDSRE